MDKLEASLVQVKDGLAKLRKDREEAGLAAKKVAAAGKEDEDRITARNLFEGRIESAKLEEADILNRIASLGGSTGQASQLKQVSLPSSSKGQLPAGAKNLNQSPVLASIPVGSRVKGHSKAMLPDVRQGLRKVGDYREATPAEMELFVALDVNGATFSGTLEGEVQIKEEKCVTWMWPGYDGDRHANDDLGALDVAVRAKVWEFRTKNIWGNYHKLKDYKIRQTGAVKWTEMEMWKIAALRSIVLDNDLAHPDEEPTAHYAQYKHCEWLDAADDVTVDKAFWNAVNAKECFTWFKNVRMAFGTITSLVAYFFRTRGHHFQDSFADRYNEIWRNCQIPTLPENPGLNWEFIARESLKAIYPHILDDAWGQWVAANAVSGALVKRYHSPAAGTAILVSLRAGLDDVSIPFPLIVNSMRPQIMSLVAAENMVKINRWAGSVNASLYGTQRFTINESEFGSLAAVIMACLERFADKSRLRDSAALKRVADQCPITGGVLGRAIQEIVKNDPAAFMSGNALPAPASKRTI